MDELRETQMAKELQYDFEYEYFKQAEEESQYDFFPEPKIFGHNGIEIVDDIQPLNAQWLMHPLIDGQNTYYVREKGEHLIREIEEKLTIEQLIGACKFNIIKYSERRKKQNESDAKKRVHYENYLLFLNSIKEMNENIKDMIAEDVYEEMGINFKF